ncbi:MAG: hypothetical protein B6D59_02155 [Campylobacteraceae bacterium 4484_4]|nr:MAG: hypothetical protein B6D59_02155 [Campylobacteraceae bacterium 4484_4]
MKPGKIDDTALLIEEELREEMAPAPRRVASGEIEEEIDEAQKRTKSTLSKIVGFLQRGGVIVSLFFAVVLFGMLYDAYLTASSMLQQSPLLATLYIILILTLGILLVSMITGEYLGYRKLRRIENLQDEGRELQKHPSKEVRRYAKKLLHLYRTHSDPSVVMRAEKVEKELESLLDSEVIPRLEEYLFKPMDEAAKRCIVKYASQTAVSTAISPVALIDAFLILSRSYVMINEIAKIYGYRPNFVGEMVLLKRVFVNLAFASITDILAHHSHDIVGSTLLSKISLYSAQGVANGILTARVGLSALVACRPIPASEQNQGFLKNLTKIIIDRIFLNKQYDK